MTRPRVAVLIALLAWVVWAGSGNLRVGYAASAREAPLLIDTNGRIDEFVIESARPVRLQLRIVAARPVALRIGGLVPGAHCSLRLQRRTLPAVADDWGELHFELAERDTGSALFTCSGVHRE